jgi:hypothetical protein
MNLHVSEQERELLTKLIDREISDLGSEIRHTNTHEFRNDLNMYRDQLRMLSTRLVASDQGAEVKAAR